MKATGPRVALHAGSVGVNYRIGISFLQVILQKQLQGVSSWCWV